VRAQTAAVTVNGESITEDGIEQRTKLNFVNTHKQSVRQDVINELADDKGKIKEAEKLGVDLGDAQVENAYAQMCWRMHIAQEQLKNLWMATASISSPAFTTRPISTMPIGTDSKWFMAMATAKSYDKS